MLINTLSKKYQALASKDLRDTLIHLVTEWDKKQAKTKSYNRYALAQYIEAVEKVMKGVKKGIDLEASLQAVFQDRMLDFITKGVKKSGVTAGISPSVHLDEMSDIEIHFILSWFVYHMPMEQRHKLMHDHPVLYKKLVKLERPEDVQQPD
jgi:hypothetical protein